MDKGHGKFGSQEWHENYINSLDSLEDVCFYVFQLRAIVLDPEKTLEKTKEKAIKAIKVH